RTFLLVFAYVALFVGGFIIFNTFSITVAQRTREFGLLRTLGATRRQVLRSVVAESLLLGLFGSLLGLALGLAVAPGLKALFNAFGANLPANGLALLGLGTLLVFLAVGLFSPRLVPPLARVVGRAVQWRGFSGRLATENAVRQPGRTATTAAALMIGLALVTFVSFLASGFT